MRFYENEQGKYRDGDIAERVIKKDRNNYLEIRPFNSTTVSQVASSQILIKSASLWVLTSVCEGTHLS